LAATPSVVLAVDASSSDLSRQHRFDDGRAVPLIEKTTSSPVRPGPSVTQEPLPAFAGDILDDDIAPITCDDQAAAFDGDHPDTILEWSEASSSKKTISSGSISK
jgi:hypothetical protein